MGYNILRDYIMPKILLKEKMPTISKTQELIISEINNFKSSKNREQMLTGEAYYIGNHDILKRERTVIGNNGSLEKVTNLPNNKIVDNQYAKLVDQKKNYLLGQPVVIKSENETHNKLLKQTFNKRFMSTLKNLGEDVLNEGIGWLFVYYDNYGNINFKRLKSYEVIPGWADAEHTILDYAIRIYSVIEYENKKEKEVEKVEVYEKNGIYRYLYEKGKLIPDKVPFSHYFNYSTLDEKGKEVIKGFNWDKIPLIPFKYNGNEMPLITRVKTLQDGLNTILSNFQNNMEEDARNTILVLVNYDGENLGEFRKNLSTYGAVKVKTVDGAAGDLKTLQVDVNADNYKAILQVFKKAIIENGMGYDAKDDRMSGNPNQMNIQSMYCDIDLDANDMETEFQASFEELLWFVNAHLYNAGLGDYKNEEVEVIFNRDILINESEAISNCQKSIGILADETIIANHPWVDDPQGELEKLKKQKEIEFDEYIGDLNTRITPSKGGGIGE